ncbi:MAG: RNA polymerase-binding protein RbpA [Kineosporiaceae bacterium]
MSDRSMRGTRLGAQSLESEAGVQPAARQDITYHCPNGHTVVVPMSVEADIPALWECRCGSPALRENTESPDAKPTKPPRTHWDMLMERRTTAELEVLLEERLALLRSGALTQRRSGPVTQRRSA